MGIFQPHGKHHRRDYMRLTGPDYVSIILCDGQFWTDGGVPVEKSEVGAWVADAMNSCSDAALAAVGFSKKPKVAEPEPETEPAPPNGGSKIDPALKTKTK